MIEIRPLTTDDSFDDLVALSKEFFHEYESYHKDFFEIDVLQDKNIIEYFVRGRDNENGKVLVAVDGNRIVGYITIYIMEQDDYWKIKKVGHVSGLMVQKEYRHRGIGAQLLAAAKSFFAERSVKYYTLFTSVENHTALDFYERSGLEALYVTMIGEIDRTGR
jgi:ribosomal protein S18 acetylase RimI-like enzyme